LPTATSTSATPNRATCGSLFGTGGLDREDFRIFGEYAFAPGYLVQLGYRTIYYDEESFDFDDYDADILEVGVGYRW
jgi:hypothetical protein